jgi:hypothetical protein
MAGTAEAEETERKGRSRVDETPGGGRNRGRDEGGRGEGGTAARLGSHSARSRSQRPCLAVALTLIPPIVQWIEFSERIGCAFLFLKS